MRRLLRTHWRLIVLIFLAFIVRLYQLTTPLADWHSFRQADTVSVAREYVKHGIDFLRPRYHDFSNIQSGFDNPEGYRMVEFPLINGMVALVALILRPWLSIELHVLYRLSSIAFSLGSIVCLYLIVFMASKKQSIALAAAAVFSFLPYSIFYSRTALPESPTVFFALFSAVLLYFYQQQSSRVVYLAASALVAALALLIKPTAIFLLLPHFAVIASTGKGFKKMLHWKWLIYGFIAVIPLLLWRQWITQFPEGIPASDWLLNGNGIRFSGAFFRWLFAERLAKLMLGYWGIHLFLLGMGKVTRYPYILLSLLSSLLYLTVFASGNVQHDYYQVLLLPVVSMVVGLGIYQAFNGKSWLPKAVLGITIIFSMAFSWYEIRGYFDINNPAIVTAGKAVQQYTPDDALVIAPYFGDTAFLYQTDRRGWPIGYEIEDKIEKGAQYYVSTSYDDEARELEDRYQLIERTDDYILIDLTKKKI